MKMKIFGFLAAVLLSLVFTGCVNTVDGHKKAGVPMAKDKIVSRYQRGVDQIVNAARVVLAHNGQIVTDDAAGKAFHAKVNTRNVWVKVSQTEIPDVSEVIVQARTRAGTGDIDLASEISKQIAIQLAVGQ